MLRTEGQVKKDKDGQEVEVLFRIQEVGKEVYYERPNL